MVWYLIYIFKEYGSESESVVHFLTRLLAHGLGY